MKRVPYDTEEIALFLSTPAAVIVLRDSNLLSGLAEAMRA
jgi:hypothetical protein